MIQQTLVPNSKIIDISFEIPNNYIGKPINIFIDFEKKETEVLKNNEENDFENWINEAENSQNLSLEDFNQKWNQKKAQIQSLIR